MLEPVITPGPRSLKLEYQELKLTIDCSRLREDSDDILGQLEITGDIPTIPHTIHVPSKFNFTSAPTRSRLAKELAEKINSLNWLELLEAVSLRVIAYIRQSEEVQTWLQFDDATPPEFIVHPFLPKKQFSIIFGDGGSGKSTLAKTITLVATLPWVDNPLGLTVKDPGAGGLYLDWESSDQQSRYDIRCLLKGMDLEPFAFNYLHCSRPLTDSLDQIMRAVTTVGAEFVMVDSLGMAAGGDLNATEPAFKLCASVRELIKANVSVLAIGHNSKNQEGKRSIYGNVFYTNEARSIWELRRSDSNEPGIVEIGLFHRKSNISQYFKPIGYKIKFGIHSTAFELNDVRNVTDFITQLRLADQIKELWRIEGIMPVKELANRTISDPRVITSTLGRMKSKGQAVYMVDKKMWGPATQLVETLHND